MFQNDEPPQGILPLTVWMEVVVVWKYQYCLVIKNYFKTTNKIKYVHKKKNHEQNYIKPQTSSVHPTYYNINNAFQ